MHLETFVSYGRGPFMRRVFGVAWVFLLLGFSTEITRADTFNLETATIADINAAFDAGTLTSEKLVQLFLKRIEAYDQKGPRLNTIITLNPKALERARALDEERRQSGPRSLMHGIRWSSRICLTPTTCLPPPGSYRWPNPNPGATPLSSKDSARRAPLFWPR